VWRAEAALDQFRGVVESLNKRQAAMDKTLFELFDYSQLNNRVCPKFVYWNAFYALLPIKEEMRPPFPLFFRESGKTYDLLRQLRFLSQIRWAYDTATIEKCDHFLRSLSEDQWHHLNE
jgi:hypothetical protein